MKRWGLAILFVMVSLFLIGCGASLKDALKQDKVVWKKDAELNQQLQVVSVYTDMAVRSQQLDDTLDAEYAYQTAIQLLDSLSGVYQDEPVFTERQQQVALQYEEYLDYTATLAETNGELDEVLTELDALYQITGDSTKDSPQESETTIPLVLNSKVESAIKYFTRTQKGRRVFKRWLERAGKYESLVKPILREVNAPEELFYLAMVESGLNPSARSYARAVGMWQFISATGRAYGLRHNWWYDERRDVVKASRAAGKHLLDLYERFGDWYLAIAGYNFSPGKIQRRLTRYDVSEFWDLPRLPRETRNYVPTYLATLTIALDPAKYGFEYTPQEPIQFDTVTVKDCIDLKVVANSVGASLSEIKQLNPSLLRWSTPPDEKTWLLNIPAGTRDTFVAKYATMPKAEKVKWLHHRVRQGEALSTIARRYGVSMNEIKKFNKIRGSLIRIGQKLIIPIPQGNVSQRSYVQQQPKSKPKPKPVSAEAPTSVPGKVKRVYTVKNGDSVWEVAQQFGVSINDVRTWNALRSSRLIQPGQQLNIWLDPNSPLLNSASLALTEKKPVSTSPKIASNANKTGNKGEVKHVVKSGDTLWDIAQLYNVSIQNLKKWNNKRSNRLKPGEELKIYQ